jgi:hypothetical protein
VVFTAARGPFILAKIIVKIQREMTASNAIRQFRVPGQ